MTLHAIKSSKKFLLAKHYIFIILVTISYCHSQWWKRKFVCKLQTKHVLWSTTFAVDDAISSSKKYGLCESNSSRSFLDM